MVRQLFTMTLAVFFLTHCSTDQVAEEVMDTEKDATADDAGDVPMDVSEDEDVDPDPPPRPTPTNYRVVPCMDHVGQAAEGMECAFLQMPQNRVRDIDFSLELFVVRPATPVGNGIPIVMLAGGPGVAHAGFAARRGLPLSLSQLLGREVIYYEQRGISPSLPSTACEGLDSFFTGPTAFATCRADLEAMGADIHSFNTLENAADVASIPDALGLEHIDLFAGSYGTRLASKVLTYHPDSVRVAILGGMDVPGAIEHSTSSPFFRRLFERAGEDYGTRCAQNEACAALHPGFDITTILSDLEALIARDGSVEILGRSVTSIDDVRELAFAMMYISQVRHMFFGALYHTANESMATYLAHIGEGDAEEGAAFLTYLLTTAQEAVFGGSSVMSHVTRCYDGQDEFCEIMGDRIDDYPGTNFTEHLGTDHPTLFLSGMLDPATPSSNVESILSLHPNAQHSTFACLGHDVSRLSNLFNGTCLVEQVSSFLKDPEAALPDCAPAFCDEIPLIPNKTDLTLQLNDYVEDF